MHGLECIPQLCRGRVLHGNGCEIKFGFQSATATVASRIAFIPRNLRRAREVSRPCGMWPDSACLGHLVLYPPWVAAVVIKREHMMALSGLSSTELDIFVGCQVGR